MKRMILLCSVLLLAVVSIAEDPAETLKKFRAPAAVGREVVKGFVWLEAEAFAVGRPEYAIELLRIRIAYYPSIKHRRERW